MLALSVSIVSMTKVTQILNAIGQGDERAADRLLPIVYDELRRLAAIRLSNEKAGGSLQPTVLVHDAYLRLVEADGDKEWNGRGHFFSAAAEAMRRIVIENARRKKSQKRGGGHKRIGFDFLPPKDVDKQVDLLALDEALSQLEKQWPEKARLVKLRFFAGFTVVEAAKALNISVATAERHWSFSKAWLHSRLK